MSIRTLTCLLILMIIATACAQTVPSEPTGTAISTPIEPAVTAVQVEISNEPTASPSAAVQVMPVASATSTEILTLAGEAQSAAAPLTIPRYRLQTGTPVALANFVAPEAGCNWLGVGGQAFNIDGVALTMLVVEVGGQLEGRDVFHLALTGNTTVLGPGGFVIKLADHGIDSSGTLWILLYDLAGQALTGKIYFPTYADCTKNFILINFSETAVNLAPPVILPLIFR